MDESSTLEMVGLTKRFGKLLAVDDVSISMRPGERHAIIGPNGSGKSTVLLLVAGVISPSSGRVFLRGKDATRWSVDRRARSGLGSKFQTPRVFRKLTVRENILLACRAESSMFGQLISRERRGVIDRAHEALKRVGLGEQGHTLAGELSHGHQQWLELAMAMVAQPKLILLDEPTAGMTADERKETANLLDQLGTSVSVLLVEHDFGFVRSVCNAVTVIDQGRVLASGSTEEVAANPSVRRAYTERLAGAP